MGNLNMGNFPTLLDNLIKILILEIKFKNFFLKIITSIIIIFYLQ